MSVEAVDISAIVKHRYLNYANSVIMSRALPDARDGLKPVQRRILYAMYTNGYGSDSRTRKCAGVVGETMKSYHPHGNTAIYEALVRMAQPFTLRYPLIYSDSNMGSVDGDPAASERYTECRLTPEAENALTELSYNCVPYRPNFDNEKQEPTVLPTQLPLLLANGAAGIAVGMATNIPPHNMQELISACITLIDNPAVTELVHPINGPIKGPDFPLGGVIIAPIDELQNIYTTGRGSFKVRCDWKIEGTGKKQEIIITSLPYGVEKNKVMEEIGQLSDANKLHFITSLDDESSLDNGIRIVIKTKPTITPEKTIAYLCKNTSLQTTFACNFTSLFQIDNNTQPRCTGIIDHLKAFLDHRYYVVHQRTINQINKLKKRLNILNAYKVAIENLDQVLTIIKTAESKATLITSLIDALTINEEQATAIAELSLYKLSNIEKSQILHEQQEVTNVLQKLHHRIATPQNIWNLIKKELTKFITTDERRTTWIAAEETFVETILDIKAEDNFVILTADGWIKRMAAVEDLAKIRIRNGDTIISVKPSSTTEKVIVAYDDGTLHTILTNDLPYTSGYGEPFSKFVKVTDGAKPIALFTTDKRYDLNGQVTNQPTKEFIIVTSTGRTSRLSINNFLETSNKLGRKCAKLHNGKMVFIGATTLNQNIFIITTDGYAVSFNVNEAPLLNGFGGGIKAIKLNNSQQVHDCSIGSMSLLIDDQTINVKTVPGRGAIGRRISKSTFKVVKSII